MSIPNYKREIKTSKYILITITPSWNEDRRMKLNGNLMNFMEMSTIIPQRLFLLSHHFISHHTTNAHNLFLFDHVVDDSNEINKSGDFTTKSASCFKKMG